MKYMGSKRTMLTNGLGTLLKAELPKHERFVDLFCGGSSVSWYAAEQGNVPVFSVDLQHFSVALSAAVTCRQSKIKLDSAIASWIEPLKRSLCRRAIWAEARKIGMGSINTATWCKRSRELVASWGDDSGLITRCYGGHYFSVEQSLIFDAMLEFLPTKPALRSVCLAAMIVSASKCAAAPGHTAQPFQPTRSAGRYLREAWMRNPLKYAEQALEHLCPSHANVKGTTHVGDAVEVAATLSPHDLVFLDPPYSSVHYSRFYHVLETIARGKSGEVSGIGRYPPPAERPTSSFSIKTESAVALRNLLQALAARKCTVILTFPLEECSNGLSGAGIEQVAKEWFNTENRQIKSRFSTLGGNNVHRSARTDSHELVLLFRPKKISKQPRITDAPSRRMMPKRARTRII